MNKDTKFYRVTQSIIADYKNLKDKTPAEVARIHDIPSGVAGHILRTIYIMRGGN